MKDGFRFEIQSQCGLARTGHLHTPHGIIPTPAFAPVGTQAAVKALEPRDLQAAGCSLILANAYHLYLRPGHERVARFGGLHEFMQWPGPILTDSGGYQVFSLSDRRQVTDEGVTFKSHLDGSLHFTSPAKAMEIQSALGSDIAMVLDECAPPHDRAYLRLAMDRTHRWAAQCQECHTRPDQILFGIVQGGIHEDLRRQSAACLTAMDFAGYALGGLAVGEAKEDLYRTLGFTCPELPASKPRYLMGVGAPEDLVMAVGYGVDLFDCVLPTRMARNGAVFHPHGRLNLRNAVHATASDAVQDDCPCYTCRHFSRGYLHHLIRCREITGLRLCTIHNVTFLQRLMHQLRDAIARGALDQFQQDFLQRYRIPDQQRRHQQRRLWNVRRRPDGP